MASTQYSDDFKTPVLTPGQSFILGYTDETNDIYEASSAWPAIIFDDFTTGFQWVDFNFKVKSSAIKILTNRDASKSNFRYLYYAMSTIRYGVSDHSRHWIEKYSKIEVDLPSLETQQNIVAVLDNFESLVRNLKSGLPAEIEKRQQQYEFYRDKLLAFPEKK